MFLKNERGFFAKMDDGEPIITDDSSECCFFEISVRDGKIETCPELPPGDWDVLFE